MGMNPLAGLLHSRNGKPHELSEREAYMQIYGERSVRHSPAPRIAEASNGNGRPRDARGRFVASPTERAVG